MNVTDVANEMEVALLSVLMRSGYLIYEVAPKLKYYMFASIMHQHIYKSMVSLGDRGIEPSRVLIKNDLISNGLLEVSGGDEYLAEISIQMYSPSSIDAYIKNIESAYKYRELVRLGGVISTVLEQTKNPDEVISRVARYIEKLITATGQEVIALSDIVGSALDAIMNRTDHPGLQGITTGFTAVDELTTGYNPSEVWTIGARPSMGKTSLLIKSLYSVSATGVPVLLVNREMDIFSITERLYSMLSGIPYLKIRSGRLNDAEKDLLRDTKVILESVPFYIDNSWSSDETYVYSTIRKYHHTKGVKVIGLDYIQLLAERDSESTATIGRISRHLKLLSGELGLTTVVLSQLNRKVEERDDKRPIMSDMRQSGNLEEDADVMVALYRDEVYTVNSPSMGVLEFIIRKARNAGIGTVNLHFDGATVNISDPSEIKEFVWK